MLLSRLSPELQLQVVRKGERELRASVDIPGSGKIQVVVADPDEGVIPISSGIWSVRIHSRGGDAPWSPGFDFPSDTNLPDLLAGLSNLLHKHIDDAIVDEYWPRIVEAVTGLYDQYRTKAT